MKILKYFLSVAVVIALLTGCRKDNYDEPSSQLSGRFVYQGEPINVEYNRVPYELYQYGFGKTGPINASIMPEGTYSHMLFDGEYKLVVREGQGPFLWAKSGGKPDTITIQVNGNTTRDIDVTPFYMIRNAQMNQAAGNVSGTFKIEQIVTGADAKTIERAALFINKTIFVGVDNNIGRVDVTGANITDPNNVSLNVNIPNISPSQNYVFARIGVKASGVEDWIFTPVQKIQF
jgi:hypothetical protein